MTTTPFTRRDFLRWASAGTGVAAAGLAFRAFDDSGAAPRVAATDSTASPDPTATSDPASWSSAPETAARAGSGTPTVAPADRRALVVIEMGGGNDGFSMLVPYGLGAYHDLRPNTAVPEDELRALDDLVAVRTSFEPLVGAGLGFVEGVGSFAPDHSHFEMMRRWWSGDSEGRRSYDTGVLGRLADLIGDPDAPAVAVSTGGAAGAILAARRASTLSLPDAWTLGRLTGASPDDQLAFRFQRALRSFGDGPSDGARGDLRRSTSQLIQLADRLDLGDADQAEGYPSTQLGDGLRAAAAMIASDLGVRIVHVPMNGDFDTHDGHPYRHAALMEDLATSLVAFRADLEQRAIAGRVLTMTASEFGRRAGDNDSDGLDHGTASTALLWGPINEVRWGACPDFSTLDEGGDVAATCSLESYYGSVVQNWFELDPGELFDGSPDSLGSLW
ncbi:MAG: DUF1501 domain-containing protein [Ilumatobacteraceae bacterium]